MDSLTLQQQALLELIKLGIGTSDGSFDFSRLSAAEWEWVMNESKNQAVVLLAFDATKDFVSYIPKDIYNKWLSYATKTLSINFRILNEQKKLAQILDSNNIPYIILKGSSSSYYYPNPDNRSYGDIDFYINDMHQDECIKLLLKSNFQLLPQENERHYTLRKNNVYFEQHKKVCGIPKGEVGVLFKKFLKNCTDGAFKNDNNISLPEASIHGVIILLHSIYHLIGFGMGIRHLCDWACFVEKTHSEPFWEDALLPLFKNTGTMEFAAMLTKICSIYLGSYCPAWAEKTSYVLCDTVMHDIYSLGNFGKKDKEKSSGGLLMALNSKQLTFFGKISALFKTLWSTNKMMYPILRKFPVLVPFIMIWRVLKYCFLMIINKRPSIFKSYRYADERSALYTQLNLFELD